MDGENSNTDPALWTKRPAFGVAGGPLVVVLTREGEVRAFAVGAQVRVDMAPALEAVAKSDGYLSRRDGHRLNLTDLGRYDQITWGHLRNLGLVVSFQNEQGDGVSLTEQGCRAVRAGVLERASLLRRCRIAAGEALP